MLDTTISKGNTMKTTWILAAGLALTLSACASTTPTEKPTPTPEVEAQVNDQRQWIDYKSDDGEQISVSFYEAKEKATQYILDFVDVKRGGVKTTYFKVSFQADGNVIYGDGKDTALIRVDNGKSIEIIKGQTDKKVFR